MGSNEDSLPGLQMIIFMTCSYMGEDRVVGDSCRGTYTNIQHYSITDSFKPNQLLKVITLTLALQYMTWEGQEIKIQFTADAFLN